MANSEYKCFVSQVIDAISLKREFKKFVFEKKEGKRTNVHEASFICNKISGFYNSL